MSNRTATRTAYGDALEQIGADSRVVVMDADLSGSTKSAKFKQKYPKRFFNAGIAEANMICAAAGLSSCGKIPFVSSFAVFGCERPFEQIRNSVCYPNMNVKICVSHAGISVGQDGATHQSVEDLAVMRSLPNMTVICPCDYTETVAAVHAIKDIEGPCFLRLSRYETPNVHDTQNYRFEIGKGSKLREGKDITIVSTGIMTFKALEAADILKAQGINAEVINIHTVKPLDVDIIEQSVRKTGVVLTVEEHSVIGGLGGAVTEALSERFPVPVKRVGINDKFGKSGTAEEVLALYGLTPENIAIGAQDAIKLKKRLSLVYLKQEKR